MTTLHLIRKVLLFYQYFFYINWMNYFIIININNNDFLILSQNFMDFFLSYVDCRQISGGLFNLKSTCLCKKLLKRKFWYLIIYPSHNILWKLCVYCWLSILTILIPKRWSSSYNCFIVPLNRHSAACK